MAWHVKEFAQFEKPMRTSGLRITILAIGREHRHQRWHAITVPDDETQALWARTAP